MIPYFQIPPLTVFGFSIHVFEILTALGIYIGIGLCLRMGKKRNLIEKNMIDAVLISVVFGFFGAHAMHVLLYQNDFSNPMQLLEIWKGISSTGGFLIGGIACWIFLKIKKLSVNDYGDCLIAGLLLAQFFGRVGCFTAHDHPGIPTHFPLAINFPEGPRHDLGFEEALLLGVFWILIYTTQLKNYLNEKSGRWLISCLIFYGTMRFLLDFLRATDLTGSDPHYWGLTPAQYVCIGFVTIAICKKYSSKTSK